MNNPVQSTVGLQLAAAQPPTRSTHYRRPQAAILLAVVLLVSTHPQASAITFFVPSQQYPTIQSAVYAVPASLTQPITIQVSAGTYREAVSVSSKHGTSSNPLIITALGDVRVDGATDLTATWTQYSTNVWTASTGFTGGTRSNQLFISDVRYTYVSTLDSLQVVQDHSYTFVDGNIYVYGNPGSQQSYVSVRSYGFSVTSSDYVTLEGFKTLRTILRGIQIFGMSSTIRSSSIVVTHCTSAFNWRQGIYLKYTSGASVASDTTYSNVGDGIYLFSSDNCQITRNLSYSNEDPMPGRDGVVGIKVGDSQATTDVANVNVDYNVVHDNEDTGIDVHGANNILVRRNVSYHNRDHGYDNQHTAYTTFINNLAANNDHDGISVESSASNVAIYNCILAWNARNGTTLEPGSTEDIAEVWVHGTAGFASNHNILFGYGYADFGNQRIRGLAEYNGALKQSLSTWQQASGQDAASRSSDPMFADTTNGNYVIYGSTSDALDGAERDLTNWLDTDPRGFAPYDVASVTDWGFGSITYADVGVFEQVPPAAISDLDFYVDDGDCTKFWLTWTAPADDGNVAASGPVTQYEMKSSSSPFTSWTGGTGVPLGLTPGSPGHSETWQVGVGFGQHRYFGIGTKDHIGLWSAANNDVVYISGPPADWTDCSEGGGTFAGGGGGGDGFRARPAAGPASVEAAGTTTLAENTLLNGVAKGTPSTDLFRLPALTAFGGNTYPVRIREASDHALALDRVRLLTVDHSSSVRTFMASGKPVLGTRVAPAQAEDATGRDITARVDGSTTNAFTGDSGAVITVKLATDATGSPDPVVIEASGLGWSSSGILVQVPDEANGWRTVGRVQPRLYFDELAVDSVASARVRLFLLGRHQVRFVGRVARSTERPTLQWAQLLKAQDSSVGDALSALSADDTAAVTLVGPDTLMLSFAAPTLAEGQVRECFLAVHGAPVLASGSRETPLRASGVESLPARFALRQNEPNPFSAATTIQFDLPAGAMARLEVFDIQGRLVNLVTDHYFPAGFQAVQWDRRDDGGGTARPGVYLYRLSAGAFRAQKKMVLLP